MSNEKIKVNYGEFNPCNTEDDAKVLSGLIEQSLRENDEVTLRVSSKDGLTTYGIAARDFFDCLVYVAGLAYSVHLKAFDCETEEDDMIWWLLSDIESAVGEEFSVAILRGMQSDVND